MTKYRVTMKEIVLHEHFIEADTSIEAFEIAWGIDDLSSSTEVQGAGWIELGEVIEMATEEDSISWGELAELTHATHKLSDSTGVPAKSRNNSLTLIALEMRWRNELCIPSYFRN